MTASTSATAPLPSLLNRDKARAVVEECIETTPGTALTKAERRLRVGGILDALESCVDFNTEERSALRDVLTGTIAATEDWWRKQRRPDLHAAEASAEVVLLRGILEKLGPVS
jgi:hypothetical protein